MKEIGNNQLAAIIKENRKYEYVAFLMTPWHMISFRAALKTIKQIDKKNGIVVVKKHPNAGQMLFEKDFEDIGCKVCVYDDDESIKDRIFSEVRGVSYYTSLMRIADKEPFVYFLKPNGFRYPILSLLENAFGKKIVAVELDEGVGSYTANQKSWLRIALIESKSLKAKMVTYAKHIETSVFNEKRLKRINRLLDAKLLSKNGDAYCANKDYVDSYVGVLKDMAINTPDILPMEGKYIIINTHPLSYVNDYTKPMDDIVMECAKYFSKKGYAVVIKPHPREKNIEKYSNMCTHIVKDYSASQEVLLAAASNKPSYIVSFLSTTLVTSKVLFDIPSISLLNIFMKTIVADDVIMNDCERYKSTFANIVEFPNVIEDI